jgi:hypothetical protein
MPVLCDNATPKHLERPDEATCAGRKDSRTQDPVGERIYIMAIAIEDVVTLLDQLREGLVEMRGYL